MDWTQIDRDWWRGSEGAWVRRVQLPSGAIRYCGWRHLQRPLYWFAALDEACRAIESQASEPQAPENFAPENSQPSCSNF